MTGNGNEVLRIVGGLALAPLFRADFLAGISKATLREAIDAWEACRPLISQGEPKLAVDLFLRAAFLALSKDDEARQIEAGLESNPALKGSFGEKPIDEALRELFLSVNAFNPAR